jgi:hypothetical protein
MKIKFDFFSVLKFYILFLENHFIKNDKAFQRTSNHCSLNNNEKR